MKFDRLRVAGYRMLYDIDVPLRNLMVLIGPNGSGKTSVLDVFRLLSDGISEKTSKHFEDRGGIDSILTRGLTEELSVGVEATMGDARLRYDFVLASSFLGQTVKSESLLRTLDSGQDRLYLKRDETSAQSWEFESKEMKPIEITDDSELILSQVKGTSKYVVSFRRALKTIAFYSGLDIDSRSPVRLPQGLTPGMLPENNGERLFSALLNMRAHDHKSYQRVTEVLESAFPDFERIEFPVVAAGKANLNWFDKHSSQPFDQSQLSEGTLRFLWLITILLSPAKPPLTIIDEPEVSLHPELLMILAEVLKEASLDSQIIVATHSDRLIRWLDPEHVTVIERKGDHSSVTWLDRDKLSHWMKDYTLDQLWSMGELGGRP